MKTAFLFPLLLVAHWCAGQGYDRNWVFGSGVGIDFNVLNSPQFFKTNSDVIAFSASISNPNGQLLFYVNSFNPSSLNSMRLCDNKGEPIINSDSLKMLDSGGGSVIILPSSEDSLTYLVIHTGQYETVYNCTNRVWCLNLYCTKVEQIANDSFIVTEKDIPLFQEPIEARLGVARHANGKDWWILAHGMPQLDNYCDTFYCFLLRNDSLKGPSIQRIGTAHDEISFFNEITFSKSGEKVAVSVTYLSKADLFKFDRCTGQLFDYIELPSVRPSDCEFSPNEKFLYVSEGRKYDPNTLYQYDLRAANIANSRQLIWSEPSTLIGAGMLETGPDNKIYLSCSYGLSELNPPFSYYNSRLSVINIPDSFGSSCDFQPFGFFLDDSVRTLYGLPNFPNYNLGALSIYQADAGIDTIICTDDTTAKGVLLGAPAVAGVAYSWHPADSLNHTDIAQPFASPATTTWYYVTLTDTSIKYSCQSRTDSVLVEVRDCSVGVESPQSTVNSPQIRIYPNPTEGILHVELLHNNIALHRIEISDLSGKRVLQQETAFISQPTTLNTLHLAKGLYFVKVELSNGQSVVQKVMVR